VSSIGRRSARSSLHLDAVVDDASARPSDISAMLNHFAPLLAPEHVAAELITFVESVHQPA
jgi:hypothetical protein